MWHFFTSLNSNRVSLTHWAAPRSQWTPERSTKSYRPVPFPVTPTSSNKDEQRKMENVSPLATKDGESGKLDWERSKFDQVSLTNWPISSQMVKFFAEYHTIQRLLVPNVYFLQREKTVTTEDGLWPSPTWWWGGGESKGALFLGYCKPTVVTPNTFAHCFNSILLLFLVVFM